MSVKNTLSAAFAALLFALPAAAEGIEVHDAYARTSSMMATSGAAFMMIHNTTGEADRLIGVKSDVAEKTELHTHKEDANGVMKMIHVEEGFDLPADGMIEMARGGKHVMFLGLTQELTQGDVIDVTLVFEKAGDVTVQVPVDMDRKPDHGAMKHGEMKHGEMNHGEMKKAD